MSMKFKKYIIEQKLEVAEIWTENLRVLHWSKNYEKKH